VSGNTSGAAAMQISPTPTDEETAAIVAAIEVAHRRVLVLEPARTIRNTSWKFSGRWWAKPLAARRDRPFL